MANDKSNPETDLLARIDELERDDITEAIRRGPTDDYNAPYKARCELCKGAWHGLPVTSDTSGSRQRGCPGAYATDEERDTFAKTMAVRRKLVPMLIPEEPLPSYVERAWVEQWAKASIPERLAALVRPARVIFERKPGVNDVAFKLSVWFPSLRLPCEVSFTLGWEFLDRLDSCQPWMSFALKSEDLCYTPTEPSADTGWWAHFQGCRSPNLAVYLRRRGQRTLGPWIAMGGDDDPPWRRRG